MKRKQSLGRPVKRTIYKEISEEVMSLRDKGLTLVEIGKRLKVAPSTVSHAELYGLGIKLPIRRQGRVRDRKKYQKVQQLWSKGLTYAEIGKEMGFSRQRAHQILTSEEREVKW